MRTGDYERGGRREGRIFANRKAVAINAEYGMNMEIAELDTDSSRTIYACTSLVKSAGTYKGVLTSG